MPLLGITIGGTPAPSGKTEYIIVTVPFSAQVTINQQPTSETMDFSMVLAELNQLALQGWHIVTCVRMSGFLIYTMQRTAP